MKESNFQKQLITDLKKTFPGCIVLKNDANYIQGIPDLTVLYKDRWALLECKNGPNSKHQTNQDYYISKGKEMSYASFVNPENKESVLLDLKKKFN